MIALSLPVASISSYTGLGLALSGGLLIAALAVTEAPIIKRIIRLIMLVAAVSCFAIILCVIPGVYRLSHLRETQQALLLEKQNIELAIEFFKYASNSKMRNHFLPIKRRPEGMPPLPLEGKIEMGSFSRSSIEGRQRLILEYGGTEAHFGYQAIFVDELEPGKQTIILYSVIETELPILLYVEKDGKKVFRIGDELTY